MLDKTVWHTNKQKLTNKQIHQKLVDEGYEISVVTINIALAEIRSRQKEVFIRQEYELGDRLEYDYGEVFLDCGEGIKTYHMAVLSSPGGGFRWLYLYTNQKKVVFMDSHVRFFEMMGGCYREIVYDNMPFGIASCPARRFPAGIPAVFQGEATQHGAKRPRDASAKLTVHHERWPLSVCVNRP